jgi:hypothetical protein
MGESYIFSDSNHIPFQEQIQRPGQVDIVDLEKDNTVAVCLTTVGNSKGEYTNSS